MNFFTRLGRTRLFAVALISATLIIPFVVCGAGLPGEHLLAQRWRALNNPYSQLSNPANIAEENYISVRATVAPVLDGAFMYSELGVNVPFSLRQTAGFTMLVESAEAVYEDEFDPNTGKLVPNTKKPLSNNKFVFSFGYAWNIWQNLIVGANLDFAYQTNFGVPLKGVGLDLGAAYRLYKHPVFGEHILGIATQNLIAPTMGISWIPEFKSTAEYARSLRLAVYSKFWGNRIENNLEFDRKSFTEWELNWRVGYVATRMFNAYLTMGFNQDVLGHWGFAIGAKPLDFIDIPGIRDLVLYYQCNIMTGENSAAPIHSFYIKADVWRHRISTSSMTAFRQAQ